MIQSVLTFEVLEATELTSRNISESQLSLFIWTHHPALVLEVILSTSTKKSFSSNMNT
jgi:hypothetical protein